MVIDTSAVTAILLQEPEAGALSSAIEADPIRIMSAANWLETQMVMQGRLGPQGGRIADTFFREVRMQLVPLDTALAQAGLAAWQQFGKGRHPARLNLGDCFAYATAILRGEKLLFKGGDFDKTDVLPAEY